MIKKYLDYVFSKSPHNRRQHAMQLASGVTAFAFLVWITTLGLRFAMTPEQIAANNQDDSTQVASVVTSQQGNATLIVATTTDSGTNSGTSGSFRY